MQFVQDRSRRNWSNRSSTAVLILQSWRHKWVHTIYCAKGENKVFPCPKTFLAYAPFYAGQMPSISMVPYSLLMADAMLYKLIENNSGNPNYYARCPHPR